MKPGIKILFEALPHIDYQAIRLLKQYYSLKRLYSNGRIINYRRRWKELSDAAGVSVGTIRSRVTVWAERGWVKKTPDYIQFVSWRRLNAILMGQPGEKFGKFLKISYAEIDRLQEIIAANQFDQHIKKQAYNHKQKHIQSFASGTSSRLSKRLRKRLLSGYDPQAKANSVLNGGESFDICNSPFLTLSRRKMGKIMGYRSATTAMKLITSMKLNGLIKKDEKTVVPFARLDKAVYYSVIDEVKAEFRHKGCGHIYWRADLSDKDMGTVYVQLGNQVRFNLKNNVL